MTIIPLLKYFFSWFRETNKASKETINDKIIKFLIFFFATRKKNFKSPTSKIFIIELILSII